MWKFIIIGVILFIVIKIFIEHQKDNTDLIGKELDDKFNVIFNALNESAFQGNGKITYLEDKKHCILYRDGTNQIVDFLYSQGMLSITWKYKYFQKEMVYRKNLSGVRNLSSFEQNKIANAVIAEMNTRISQFKKSVTQEF